jgi:hypothetical protein
MITRNVHSRKHLAAIAIVAAMGVACAALFLTSAYLQPGAEVPEGEICDVVLTSEGITFLSTVGHYYPFAFSEDDFLPPQKLGFPLWGTLRSRSGSDQILCVVHEQDGLRQLSHFLESDLSDGTVRLGRSWATLKKPRNAEPVALGPHEAAILVRKPDKHISIVAAEELKATNETSPTVELPIAAIKERKYYDARFLDASTLLVCFEHREIAHVAAVDVASADVLWSRELDASMKSAKIALDCDQAAIAIWDQSQAIVIDSKTGDLVVRIPLGHEQGVTAACLASEQHALITAGEFVSILNWQDGKKTAVATEHQDELARKNKTAPPNPTLTDIFNYSFNFIYAVAITEDSSALIAVTPTGTVWMWKVVDSDIHQLQLSKKVRLTGGAVHVLDSEPN